MEAAPSPAMHPKLLRRSEISSGLAPHTRVSSSLEMPRNIGASSPFPWAALFSSSPRSPHWRFSHGNEALSAISGARSSLRLYSFQAEEAVAPRIERAGERKKSELHMETCRPHRGRRLASPVYFAASTRGGPIFVFKAVCLFFSSVWCQFLLLRREQLPHASIPMYELLSRVVSRKSHDVFNDIVALFSCLVFD